MTTTLRAVLAKSMTFWACTLSCAAAADAGHYSGQEEARNLRLVGFHDLAARSAYQPTIKRQGERWILYVGHHGGKAVNPLSYVNNPNVVKKT